MAKQALLVFELQNDYLWEKRKEKFPYDTKKLISAVNAAISQYQAENCDILYLAQIFPDTPTNHLVFGFCIEQTEGAKLYSELQIASDLYFEKNLPDSYSSKPFREFMKERAYSEIVLCGLDECGCVGATAKGAVRTGAAVLMLENCIGRRFSDAEVKKMRDSLISSGVRYISL